MNIRFSKRIFLRNHILVLIGLVLVTRLSPSRVIREWFVRRSPYLAFIESIDLAASVAGGDSFSDIYGLGRLFYVALPQVLCLLARKRLILMPQTLGPFQNWIAKALARYILFRAEVVYSRDYRGLEYVRRLMGPKGIGRELRFCPDLGLLLDPTPAAALGIVGLAPRVSGRCVIGLNVSGLLCKSGGRVETRATFKADYELLVSKLIPFLIRTKQSAVLLIPHVFGSSSESDSVVCDRVYRELSECYPGRLGIASGKLDQHQVKGLIGTCDFFIGSRMHACIAAASQAVPAVSIAYSEKFIGVMETLGLGGLVADLRTMSESEILTLISSAFDGRNMHRQRLEKEMPKIKCAVLNLFAGFGNV